MQIESIILVLNSATLALMGVSLFILHRKTTDQHADQHEEVPDERDNLRDHLTAYELERLEREESFDARITQIKDELAKQQHVMRSSGISADELHPLVKNLPHNIIAEKHSAVPDVEYAE